jgi:hypothetical protein
MGMFVTRSFAARCSNELERRTGGRQADESARRIHGHTRLECRDSLPRVGTEFPMHYLLWPIPRANASLLGFRPLTNGFAVFRRPLRPAANKGMPARSRPRTIPRQPGLHLVARVRHAIQGLHAAYPLSSCELPVSHSEWRAPSLRCVCLGGTDGGAIGTARQPYR